jgi:flagellar hook-length control protein FliK
MDVKAWIKAMNSNLRSDAPGPGSAKGIISDMETALSVLDASARLTTDLKNDWSQGDGAGQQFAPPTPAPEIKTTGSFSAQQGLAGSSATLTGQDLADKMSQAIGQRLLDSIEKGDWQVKMNLKPAELGHIEVDLRMKDHALEAHFSTSQSLTKDLLELGIGRLKDTLQQSGMDVASIRINDGQSSRSGGDSTPGQAQSGGQGPKPRRDQSSETMVTAIPQKQSETDGGLDLMV